LLKTNQWHTLKANWHQKRGALFVAKLTQGYKMYRSFLKASALRYLSLLVLVLSLPNIARSEQKVVIGFDAGYPTPFAYLTEAGEPAGICTENSAKAFMRVDGYNVELRGYPWKRLMKLVEDGGTWSLPSLVLA